MPNNPYIFLFPDFDPVAFHVGWISIRWYALSYIAGILIGWWLCVRLINRWPGRVTRAQFDDYMAWLVVGIIIGGRLGQVLLWAPDYYLERPLEILFIWHGGMSFHGGLIGVIVATVVFARVNKIPPLALSDLAAVGVPIGLGLGRIANFVNGELVGRPTDGTWGVIFPKIDQLPRHPSQLYEALLEGLLLFIVVAVAVRRQYWRDSLGKLTGLFFFGYALARATCEFFREPEVDLGALGFVTWGQVLCVPMAAFGLYLMLRRQPRQHQPEAAGQ